MLRKQGNAHAKRWGKLRRNRQRASVPESPGVRAAIAPCARENDATGTKGNAQAGEHPGRVGEPVWDSRAEKRGTGEKARPEKVHGEGRASRTATDPDFSNVSTPVSF